MANPDGYEPVPGHRVVFALPHGRGPRTNSMTRQINRLLRDTADLVIAERVAKSDPVVNLRSATANYDRRQERRLPSRLVPAHYVHGFGTPVRDTHTATYWPSLREVEVCFPPNYRGENHETTDDWLRTRVAIFDALLKALTDINAQPIRTLNP